MTLRTEIEHLAHRKEFLVKVEADPTAFQICDQCESLNAKTVPRCIYCNAYRFRVDPQEVLAHAREVCRRPFPATLGTVPRLTIHPIGSILPSP